MKEEDKTMRGVFAGTVGRPVAMAVAFVTLLVLGGIAYSRIPLQLLPQDFTEPQLNIWIPNPDSNARENEERVARPIEEQLRTLAGIEDTISNSNEGYVWMRVKFDAKIDMDLARAEVRDRLERAWPQLPETVQPAGMWSESASSLPISFFGISVKGDPARRDYLLDKVVKPRLESVQGIGRVDLWGVLQDSVRILLDEDAVIAAGLDIGTVIQRLSSDNFALPMGDVKDGGREVILRSDMRFRSIEEVADFPIANGLRLKDIGRVAKVKQVRDELTLIDGNPAYYGMATKDSQSNVVETSHNLRAMCEAIEADPICAGDVSISLFFVQGDFIESALTQLQQTAMWGGLLAVGVLFVFLRRVRLTLCVALSIPVSALLAIAFNYFTGQSFNMLAMTGITLAIGMLVDNSVVVVENIVRIKQRGENRLTAAVLGSRQIALAVTLATLTTVVVFLPLIFMSDNPMVRVMFGAIGIPLSVSLLASLFVALVFLPVVAARTLGKDGAHEGETWFARAFARVGRVPVRIVAWLTGGLRVLWYLVLRGLHGMNRIGLRVLPILRWVLVPAVVALAVLKQGSFEEAFRAGSLLEEFGVKVGPEGKVLGALLVAAAVIATLGLTLGLRYLKRRPHVAPARPARFVPAGDSLIDMVVQLNQSLVAWTLKHRKLATGMAGLAFLSVFFPWGMMSVAALGQGEPDDDASFRVVFDTEFTLEEAEEQIQPYASFIEERRDDIGFEHWTCRFRETGAQFQMHFGDSRPAEEVDRIESMLEEDLPRLSGHQLVFYNEDASEGLSTAVARFTLTGPDSRELERLSEQAVDILEQVPGLDQVTSPLARAPEMIEVRVDRELAHGLGVTTQSIQNSISWTLGGWPLPRYHEEGREIPLVIEYDGAEIAGLPSLRDLAIFAQSGLVPLTAVAELEFTRGARTIFRRNGQTSFTLEAKVDDPLQIIPVTETAYRALDQIELPRGFAWDRSDSASARTEEEMGELWLALGFALVLVFLLMAILFESILLPFSVLFTVPFALMGATWTLYLTNTPMDTIGVIGGIILSGVVVNNGIVLLDRIHNLRGHMSRSQAILDGCSHRVRPILMTALTTVSGLLPMALSEPPPQSIDYRTLATIVAGGLIFSTFFTLWVVPLAYTILDDVWHALTRWLRWYVRPSTGKRRERSEELEELPAGSGI